MYFRKLFDRSYKSEIIFKSAESAILRFIGIGLSLGFNLVLARCVSSAGVGIYQQAFILLQLAGTLARFGLENAALRFVAAHADQNEWESVAGIYRQTLLFIGSMSSLAALALIILSPVFAWLFSESRLLVPLIVMALATIPFNLTLFYSELLRALKHITESLVILIIIPPLLASLMTIVFSQWLGLWGAPLAYLVGSSVAALVGFVLWHRAAPQIHGIRGHFERNKLFQTGAPIWGVQLLGWLLGASDTFILSLFATSSEVGVYSIARNVAMQILMTLKSVSSIAAPKFAALYARGEFREMGVVGRTGALLTTLTSLPILAGFLFFPEIFLRLFGDTYTQGVIILQIMALAQFINAATGPIADFMIMTGLEKIMRNLTLFQLVISIAAQLITVPIFGTTGLAVVYGLTHVSMNLLNVIIAYYRYGLVMLPLPTRLAGYLEGLRAPLQ